MEIRFATIPGDFKMPNQPTTMQVQRFDSTVAPELRITGTPHVIVRIGRMLHGLTDGSMVVVNGAELWAKIEAYGEACYDVCIEDQRTPGTDKGWQERDRLTADIRAALGLPPSE